MRSNCGMSGTVGNRREVVPLCRGLHAIPAGLVVLVLLPAAQYRWRVVGPDARNTFASTDGVH
jgi:hypothetical protein